MSGKAPKENTVENARRKKNLVGYNTHAQAVIKHC